MRYPLLSRKLQREPLDFSSLRDAGWKGRGDEECLLVNRIIWLRQAPGFMVYKTAILQNVAILQKRGEAHRTGAELSSPHTDLWASYLLCPESPSTVWSRAMPCSVTDLPVRD